MEVPKSRVFTWLIVAILWIGCVCLFIAFKKTVSVIDIGKPSPQDIIAPFTAEVVDKIETERKREEAARSVEAIYRVDPSITYSILQSVERFFMLWESLVSLSSTDETRRDVEKKLTKMGLSADDIDKLSKAPPKDVDRIRRNISAALEKTLKAGLYEKSVREKTEQIAKMSGKYADVVRKVLARFLRPNVVYDEEATKKQRDLARSRVKPVTRTVIKGEVIVKKGEIITPETYSLLVSLGITSPGLDARTLLAFSVLSLLLILIPFIYLIKFAPLHFCPREVGLLTAIGLSFVAISLFVASKFSEWLIPVISLVLVAGLTTHRDAARIFVTSMFLIVAMALWLPIVEVVAFMVWIWFASTFIGRVTRWREVLIFGVRSAVYGLVPLAFACISVEAGFHKFVESSLYLILNSFLSVTIGSGFFAVVGSVFKIASPFLLVELTNPDHPLLKLLREKAQGTYQHSFVVADLAEEAADAVGANKLLAKVGAYYHDVGKTEEPWFFIENIPPGGKNPHDDMPPDESARKIISHVEKGIALARRYLLPSEIVDIIAQHHGTGIVYYFLKKARKQGQDPPEDAFRYPGPKPQTKEAAIVMLADTVEATVRARNPKTEEEILQIIRERIRARLDEGQLDESELTLADLKRIEQAFLRVFQRYRHTRIPYREGE